MDSSKCVYCAEEDDDVHHTVLCCEAWHGVRTKEEIENGEALMLDKQTQYNRWSVT